MNANGDSHIVAILKISLIILKSMVFRKTLKAPGFDFKSSEISGAGIIVPFVEDIPTVAHDILTLIDRGIIGRNTFKFIIAVESLQSWTQLSEPGALLTCINDNTFGFESFLIYLHLK